MVLKNQMMWILRMELTRSGRLRFFKENNFLALLLRFNDYLLPRVMWVVQFLMSGSCHLDRALNDKFSVEFCLFVCLFYLVLKHSYQGLVKNLDGNEIKKYINISYSKIIF